MWLHDALNQLYYLVPWYFRFFFFTYALLVAGIVALVLLIPTGIGLVRYRNRANLWWIIPCVAIEVHTLWLGLLLVIYSVTYVGN